MKIKPYNKYKKIDLPWLERIPSHWDQVRNKHLLVIKEDRVGLEHGEYTLLSLTKKGIIKRDMENPQGKFPKEFDTYKIVSKNDIIFCLFDIDETPRTVGLSDFEGMITGAYDIFSIENINRRYYYYYYLYLDDFKMMKPLYTGLRKTININRFMRLLTPCPPKNEQDKIVAFLDNKLEKIDKFIDLKTRQIELLKEQKETMINKAVTKGLDDNVEMKDSRIDLVEQIPINWESMPLKRIFNIKNGNGFPIELQGKTKGKYPFLKVSDINSLDIYVDSAANYLEELDVKNEGYGIVPKNSIIIAKIGEALKKNHRKINNVDCLIDNNLQALIPIRINHNQIKYLYYLMKIIDMNWFDNAGTVPSINNRKLMAFKVPLAPKTKQNKIVEFIQVESKKIDETISLYQKEIDLIKEYKMSLISSAVTGKIDIREFEGVNID